MEAFLSKVCKDSLKTFDVKDLQKLRILNYSEMFVYSGRNFLILALPTSLYMRQYQTVVPVILFVLILLFTAAIVYYM